VAETTDWKERYQEALRQFAADEKRWQALESLLRRIVSRVCAAPLGLDDRLDEELTRLAAAVRRQGDADELARHFESLSRSLEEFEKPLRRKPTDAVPAGPAPAATHPASGDASKALLDAARRLLGALAGTAELRQRVDAIGAKLAAVATQETLAAALTQMAILAAEQAAVFERGRQELMRLLTQINARLEDMTDYLVGEDTVQTESDASTQILDARVKEEVRALGSQSESLTDLKQLQHLVRARLDAINSHLIDFRARELARIETARARTADMRRRIAELEQQSVSLEARLKDQSRLALIDPATGIANRLAYDREIAKELARWEAEGTPFSLAAWDIDHFKAINDSYGHAAGDRVLKVVAEQLVGAARGTDTVARYGGEEFVMILPATAGREAERLCEAIRSTIMTLGFHFRGAPVAVTSSCGIATVAAGDTPETLFGRADQALYRAKAAGRNRCARV